MARFYANENFPLDVVEHLRSLGHDVLTVAETGWSDQAWPDDEVLGFAKGDRRAQLTYNRKHFIRLHTLDAGHSGIVVCSVDRDFVALAERIHAIVGELESLNGRL